MLVYSPTVDWIIRISITRCWHSVRFLTPVSLFFWERFTTYMYNATIPRLSAEFYFWLSPNLLPNLRLSAANNLCVSDVGKTIFEWAMTSRRILSPICATDWGFVAQTCSQHAQLATETSHRKTLHCYNLASFYLCFVYTATFLISLMSFIWRITGILINNTCKK